MSVLYYNQTEFVKDVAKLIEKAQELKIDLTIGEAYRTMYQQLHYLETNKSLTIHSNHLRRLAIDFNFFNNNELIYRHDNILELGRYWESLNEKNRWGGNFKKLYDPNHFERNI